MTQLQCFKVRANSNLKKVHALSADDRAHESVNVNQESRKTCPHIDLLKIEKTFITKFLIADLRFTFFIRLINGTKRLHVKSLVE